MVSAMRSSRRSSARFKWTQDFPMSSFLPLARYRFVNHSFESGAPYTFIRYSYM